MSASVVQPSQPVFIAKDGGLWLGDDPKGFAPVALNIASLLRKGRKIVDCDQASDLRAPSIRLCITVANDDSHEVFTALIPDVQRVLEIGAMDLRLFKRVLSSPTPISKISAIRDGVFASAKDGALYYGDAVGPSPKVHTLVGAAPASLAGSPSGPMADIVAAKDGIATFLSNLLDALPKMVAAVERRVGQEVLDAFAAEIKAQQKNLGNVFNQAAVVAHPAGPPGLSEQRTRCAERVGWRTGGACRPSAFCEQARAWPISEPFLGTPGHGRDPGSGARRRGRGRSAGSPGKAVPAPELDAGCQEHAKPPGHGHRGFAGGYLRRQAHFGRAERFVQRLQDRRDDEGLPFDIEWRAMFGACRPGAAERLPEQTRRQRVFQCPLRSLFSGQDIHGTRSCRVHGRALRLCRVRGPGENRRFPRGVQRSAKSQRADLLPRKIGAGDQRPFRAAARRTARIGPRFHAATDSVGRRGGRAICSSGTPAASAAVVARRAAA